MNKEKAIEHLEWLLNLCDEAVQDDVSDPEDILNSFGFGAEKSKQAIKLAIQIMKREVRNNE